MLRFPVKKLSPKYGYFSKNHTIAAEVSNILNMDGSQLHAQLATDASSARNDMASTHRQETLPRTLNWKNPQSRAISRKTLCVPRSTAAIMTSPLAGVRAVRGQPSCLTETLTRIQCKFLVPPTPTRQNYGDRKRTESSAIRLVRLPR